MSATLTYSPFPLQNPAGILRADPCDPRRYLVAPSTAPCPVQPLKGLRRTRAAVSYRVFAPVGANLPFTIEGNPSVSPTIVHCSLYIVHCTLSELHLLRQRKGLRNRTILLWLKILQLRFECMAERGPDGFEISPSIELCLLQQQPFKSD